MESPITDLLSRERYTQSIVAHFHLNGFSCKDLQLPTSKGLNETQEDPEVSQTLSNAFNIAREWQQWCQARNLTQPQIKTYPGQILQGFYDLNLTYEGLAPFRVQFDQRQQQQKNNLYQTILSLSLSSPSLSSFLPSQGEYFNAQECTRGV